MTIPASQVVNVLPNVLSAGGTAVDIIGVMLTQNFRVPINSFNTYLSELALSSDLGASSVDAAAGTIYFGGFDGSTVKPGKILVARYPTASVGAYLRSASLAGVALATIQAFTGPLSVAIDGYTRTSANVNLSAAVSFSGAASIIQTALNTAPTTVATYTASIAGTTMTVSGTLTGQLAVGQTVTGSNTAAGSIILAQLTGLPNGTGTYQLAVATGTVTSQTLSSIPTPVSVIFDSVQQAFYINSGIVGNPSTAAFASGTIATDLLLTQALGAVLSQGTVAATPAAFMTNLTRLTQNWATFFANFDVDGGSGNINKLAFAQWTSTTNHRYAYLAGDADTTPTLSATATSSLGAQITTLGYDGTSPIFDPSIYPIAAFVSGAAASINFNEPAGRITFAFKSQAGLTPTVTDGTVAQNLEDNNYNFYGAYATANNGFEFYNPGSISGEFLWLDSYINQIWLNAQLQLALLTFMTQIKSIPYNDAGFSLVAQALADIINQGLTFGAYSPGVTLSSSQIAEVNAAAGGNIAPTLQNRGWFLLIQDPGAIVRQQRGSPLCNFWYADGESVQQITLNSIAT